MLVILNDSSRKKKFIQRFLTHGMKKIFGILVMVVFLISCEKEVSGCGEITGVGRVDCSSGDCFYYLPVRFDSGNTQEVSVTEDVWVNSFVGERICF
jgi:hypothetical protein